MNWNIYFLLHQPQSLVPLTFPQNIGCIIIMLNKKHQTANYYNPLSFGKTIKLNPKTRHTVTSTSSKQQSRVSSKKRIPPCNLLAKTYKKAPLPPKSLKGMYDELVNDLFLKIDFDCSGYITYTKIMFCKDIPEKAFYFLGGVFQKIRQLGGVSAKLFLQIC